MSLRAGQESRGGDRNAGYPTDISYPRYLAFRVNEERRENEENW